MRNLSAQLLNLIGFVFTLALLNCGGGVGDMGNSTLGGGNHALPGTEEVAIAPGVDVELYFLRLKCLGPGTSIGHAEDASGPNMEKVSQAPDNGDNHTSGLQPQLPKDTFLLSINMTPVKSPPAVIRLVDKNNQEYRQIQTDSSGHASVKWKTQESQNADFLLASISDDGLNDDPKPCPNATCRNRPMTTLSACLDGPSCSSYGWSYTPCVLLPDPNNGLDHFGQDGPI